MQGEMRLDDGQVALTGIALPIVNATIAQRVRSSAPSSGTPIVGIPISVSGDISDPQVTGSRPTAIAGALVSTLQSVMSLPVQLLGAARRIAGVRSAKTDRDSGRCRSNGAARDYFLAVAAVTCDSSLSAPLLLTVPRTRMSGGSTFFP